MSFFQGFRHYLLVTLPWVPVGIFFTEHGYSLATVNGRSMQPSLNPDSNQLKKDVVIFNRWKVANFQYNIGDVVSYRRPDEPNRIVIKRIVALEGDVVRTRKPYPDRQIRVPAGHCWVEGDEMFHSTDSNHYGPVPLGLLQRKAEYIIYPFNRIGRIPKKPRTSRVQYAPGHKIYNRLDDIQE